MPEFYDGANRYLGTYHMADDAAFEPLRNNNFELQITGLTNLENFSYADAESAIRLSVASFTAPNITVSEIVIPYGNNKIKYAGVPDFSSSTLTCNDYIGINVERVLSDWFRRSYDPKTQKVGLAIDYKKVAYLIEYDPSGNFVRSWKLKGCWISNLTLGDFNQEGGAVRQVTVTITYDVAIPEE